MNRYEELAARRYRRYKLQEQTARIKAEAIMLGLELTRLSAPVLRKCGILAERSVEKVRVE